LFAALWNPALQALFILKMKRTEGGAVMDERRNYERRASGKSWTWIAGAIVLGSSVTYLFDPVQGRRRRALMRDKGVHLINRTCFYGGKIYRDLRNRSKGVVAKTLSVADSGATDDATLVKRVRSAIGRKIRHAKAIDVQVNNGEVTLGGPILAGEVDDLIRCVKDVPGAEGVINHLEIHESPGNIPSLQGEGKQYFR
jgi:hypothetical protein